MTAKPSDDFLAQAQQFGVLSQAYFSLFAR
jgi:hypothetical protein